MTIYFVHLLCHLLNVNQAALVVTRYLNHLELFPCHSSKLDLISHYQYLDNHHHAHPIYSFPYMFQLVMFLFRHVHRQSVHSPHRFYQVFRYFSLFRNHYLGVISQYLQQTISPHHQLTRNTYPSYLAFWILCFSSY
jgi:hypothetical protein